MATFWQSLVDMLQTLLDYIKSIRESESYWYFQAMESMIKWLYAYDHVYMLVTSPVLVYSTETSRTTYTKIFM